MNSGMVREDSDVALEASHFAFLQQNKNILANNVLWKRKEQLVKWETSETNRLPSVRKLSHESKVKFTDEDIFLSACLSGDLEEVQTLLSDGANINTSTVDGLTALHQAVIDGKPKMVQFLVEHGANVNAQDNEGWTPLHAAACCGNVDLVEYLCAGGADLSVTNSDKELAVDLAEEDDCRLALEEEHQRQGINPDECRNRELAIMRRDAEQWLKDGEMHDHPHSRTGATALHVAAAKGYNDVIRLLLKAGADVNCRDRDGWTPLHAAAHWGEHEAATILIQNGASFSELTNNGETVLNVADKDIVEYLEGMQEKERLKLTSNSSVNILAHSNTPLKRAGSTTSVLRMSTEEKTKKTKLDERDEKKELKEGDYSFIIEDKSPSPSVEVRLPFPVKQHQPDICESPSEDSRSSKSNSEGCSEEKTASISESKNSDLDKSGSTGSESVAFSESDQKRSLAVEDRLARVTTVPSPPPIVPACVSESKSPSEVIRNSTSPSSSTTISSLTSRSASIDSNSSIALSQNQPWLKTHSAEKAFATTTTSLESSTRFSKSVNLQRSTSTPVPWMPLYRSSAVKGPLHPAFAHFQAAVRQAATDTVSRNQPVTNACLLQTGISSLSRGSLATPPMEPNMPNESEAERRSRAKRQRDSRRSTQGVTREQLRFATTLTVRRDDKEKDRENDSQRNGTNSSSSLESTSLHEIEKRVGEERKDFDAKIYSPNQSLSAVRRRSQAPRNTRRVTGPVRIENLQSDEASDDSVQKSSGDMSSANTTTPSSPNVDRSNPVTATTSYNFRDNALTTIAYTQTALPGKVRTTQTNSIHIGGGTATTTFQMLSSRTKCQETTVDYKALYEKEKQETERLRHQIEELSLEKSNSANSIPLLKCNIGGRLTSLPSLNKSSSSVSMNDRERHSYEQRIAEMQYEIEQLEHLRADNQKLKEENGALIRVISKLSK
uniref:ANK_REP_REGION domain-containing protein n=1 Tax=Wuchereria bancrofti TaxID=6293 RepID=A0A1I8EX71_WUCBA